MTDLAIVNGTVFGSQGASGVARFERDGARAGGRVDNIANSFGRSQPINDVIGRFTDAKNVIRRDNTFLGKVDFEAGAGRLSVTASRMRPFGSVPRAPVDNDQHYTHRSKRH